MLEAGAAAKSASAFKAGDQRVQISFAIDRDRALVRRQASSDCDGACTAGGEIHLAESLRKGQRLPAHKLSDYRDQIACRRPTLPIRELAKDVGKRHFPHFVRAPAAFSGELSENAFEEVLVYA